MLRQTEFLFAEVLLWVSFPHRLLTPRAYCLHPNHSTLISQYSCKEPRRCLVMFNKCASADVNVSVSSPPGQVAGSDRVLTLTSLDYSRTWLSAVTEMVAAVAAVIILRKQ